MVHDTTYQRKEGILNYLLGLAFILFLIAGMVIALDPWEKK